MAFSRLYLSKPFNLSFKRIIFVLSREIYLIALVYSFLSMETIHIVITRFSSRAFQKFQHDLRREKRKRIDFPCL